MGVAMSCSMVPRSHSRATVRELSSPPITVMITATSPGTMKFLLSSSGLYQTRRRPSTAGGRLGPPVTSTATCSEYRLVMVSM
jgi:hypothetical protein